jgi:hypothetical protein
MTQSKGLSIDGFELRFGNPIYIDAAERLQRCRMTKFMKPIASGIFRYRRRLDQKCAPSDTISDRYLHGFDALGSCHVNRPYVAPAWRRLE